MPEFPGFRQEDFKNNVEGTTWRSQNELGGVLAAWLEKRSGVPFRSVPIYRVPEVYLVPATHWKDVLKADQGYPRCKLLVRADATGLRFGFYVEKGYGKPEVTDRSSKILDPSWDWHRFIALVNRAGQELSLPDLMRQHGLRLYLDYSDELRYSLRLLATARPRPDDALDVTEDDVASVRDWSYIADKIVAPPAEKWANVYLEQFLTKEEAVAAHEAIVDKIAWTLCALLPLLSNVAGVEPIQCSADQPRKDEEKVITEPPPVAHPSIGDLAAYLENRFGLRFTPHQIACYITALQTKGFVILSGMSGTGKTRLAQAFVGLLRADDDGTNYLFLPVRPDWRDNKALVGYYNPILCHYESTELLRFVLDAQQEREAPRQASMADAIRVALKTPTDKSWLAGLKSMQQRLTGKQASQLTSEDLDLLWVQRSNGIASIGQAIATSLPHDERLLRATEIAMDKKRTPGERFADAVKVLAPPNHWARVWRTVAAFDIENVHTIVHGRKVRELLAFLGFQSPQDPRSLAERNQPGEIDKGIAFIMSEVDRLLPGLDTLERAIAPWLMWEYCNSGGNTAPQAQQAAAGAITPFFVLLDEMNLAHVEHYFADFLSVLESGRRENGFTREEIRLHSFEAPVQDAEGRAIPPALALPPNLYIVGTVNVDETTHAFSPKVLDRAFTIEFEAADLESYPASQGNAEAALSDHQRAALQTAFIRDGRFAIVEKAPTITGSSAKDSGHMNSLRDLEQRLRPYELHFGYRVVDEILAYLANAEKYGWFDNHGGLDAAFDSAVLMKVLPKFHGPRARLREPLHEILGWTGMPNPPDATTAKPQDYLATISSIRQTLANGPDHSQFRCPRTALKCLRMLYQLSVTGFAAFS